MGAVLGHLVHLWHLTQGARFLQGQGARVTTDTRRKPVAQTPRTPARVEGRLGVGWASEALREFLRACPLTSRAA